MMRKITKRTGVLPPVLRQRVAAYARVSSGKDAMLDSLSAQISYYNAYIGRRSDWELAGIYADEALTGTKDTRPEFQRMLDDCRAGKIDIVITKSVTRFARNTVILLETVRELKALGIDVWFEKENIRSMSGDGELMLTILASYAQEESRSASENCKWRIRRKFEKGELHTSIHMLGYRPVNGGYQIIPEEAAIVRGIFSDYLSGMGCNAIMKKLNQDGFTTKRGGPWNESTVAGILKNEKYMGEMLLQKTYVEDHLSKKKKRNRGELPMYHVTQNHEAIIDKETFEAVQQKMRERAKKHNPSPARNRHYPFTSMIRCGLCGACYRRKITVSTKYKKAVWICPTYNVYGKSACPSQQIPETILMAKAAEVMCQEVFDEDAFRTTVVGIQVPAHNRLVFRFFDEHISEITWQNPSRRESWSNEMKQKARERQLACMAKKHGGAQTHE
jgi:DNA invertase Pin-like site-specific DNA recombinase